MPEPSDSSKYWDIVLENMAYEDQKPIANRNYASAISKASRIKYQQELAKNTTAKDIAKRSSDIYRLRSYQEKLTPKLMEKYPEAKETYDKAVGQFVVDRRATLDSITGNYQLTPDDVKEILGEEGANDFYSLQGQISEDINREWPGAANVIGANESIGNLPNYGLRSALLTQYTGESPTIEQLDSLKAEYNAKYGGENR